MCFQPLRSLLVCAWSSNERERVSRKLRPHHRWGQSRPTFATERTLNHSASSAQWDTFEEIVDTEDEDNDDSDTIDPGDLQEYVRDELEVLAPAWTMVKMMQVWTIHSWKPACLKLAELPEALAIVQANLDNHLVDNVYRTVRVISDRVMTDQLRSSEELNDLGHSLNNAEARNCKRSWTNEGHAASVMRVTRTGHWAGNPQCPLRPVNVIELEDEVQEFEQDQDAGTRQILSVQVDVSDVCFLRPSTRLVLAVNSMDVERREGPVVSSTLQLDTQLLEELGTVRTVTSVAERGVPVVLEDLFCCPTALWKVLCYP